MKCKYCNSEWKPSDSRQAMFCPLCQRPMISIRESFNNLEEVLLYLVQEYGAEIFRNRYNLLRFVDCFLSDGKREHNFISMLYESGLLDFIFRFRNSSGEAQNRIAKQASAQLCDSYGITAEWADYIIGCVCKSLGMANGVDHSFIKISQLAELGNSHYQFKLAEYYRVFATADNHFEKYLYWLGRAAENFYPAAMYQLGEALWYGNICERNTSEAVRLIKEAVNSGSWDAVCFVAANTEVSKCCNIDFDVYVQKMLQLEEELSAEQYLCICLYYLRDEEYNTALDLARKAYEKNKKLAWESYIYILELKNSRKSKIIALCILKEVASEGDINACKRLAELFCRKAKTEAGMRTAVYWYRMAAEAGDTDAQIKLARIYESGYLMQKDTEKAVYWYRIAAYSGSEYAKNKVNYKSRDCIIKTIRMKFDDKSEQEYKVEGTVSFEESDYLILSGSDIQDKTVVLFRENDRPGEYEFEEVEEVIEDVVLCWFELEEYSG